MNSNQSDVCRVQLGCSGECKSFPSELSIDCTLPYDVVVEYGASGLNTIIDNHEVGHNNTIVLPPPQFLKTRRNIVQLKKEYAKNQELVEHLQFELIKQNIHITDAISLFQDKGFFVTVKKQNTKIYSFHPLMVYLLYDQNNQFTQAIYI